MNRSKDVIIVLLFAAVVYLVAIQKLGRNPERIALPSEPPSIVVLPFDRSDEEFANDLTNGIIDKLIGRLERVDGLNVATRTESYEIKGNYDQRRELAQEFGFSFWIEVAAHKQGNRVRVIAQLIDIRTEGYLWSDTYNHELDNSRRISDEIALAVSRTLRRTGRLKPSPT